jgi:hypothetical protein
MCVVDAKFRTKKFAQSAQYLISSCKYLELLWCKSDIEKDVRELKDGASSIDGDYQ